MKNITHYFLRHISIAASAALLLFLTGCGPSGNAGKTSSGKTASAPAPATGRAIEVTANDTMKFSLTEIRAKPGEALSITLKNVGTMPKFSMGHNFIVLGLGLDATTFINDAAQAVKTDYVPVKYKSRILASTKLLGPGESDTITFKAPASPGRYPFVCSFPGHFQVGMKGDLIVE